MADTVACPACGTGNEADRKFCGECGSPLTRACPSCGTANALTVKFCGECGQPLAATAAPATASTQAAPAAERRLVSVLFADLVGYTALSEGRDFEDVRDLQTRYFDTARTVIERYGGSVEKFIGDAVMAVWGAPVAQEDDPERAVRAALELVDAVSSIGTGGTELHVRAGVLTGEAAVTIGASGQGMVTGDLVNTASRIQAAAAPGTVLVGDSTHRATEAAIAYAAAGERELKGKSEPVQLWQALRVIANRGGEGRSVGLESPFVGRERELRLAKELFHASAEDGTARLLSIVGAAGMGKSRLSWEFEKYVDGLVDTVYWHRGRCLAYGEGVAYWALADMVRMRARITEDEGAETAIPKLSQAIAEAVADPAERAFVEPRLQHLLGLTERTAPDREDLFSAWRLFVERMAEQYPVVMVFEDIHWADASLIDFIEALLERSRTFPIFVLTLARPDVLDRHPGFGSRVRSFTSIMLDALGDDAIDSLLRGLVPGIPDDAVARIRERAEGIPFYAVETVRMLLDRGLLEPGEGGYRVTGDVSSLQIPETLQTLIAARLDSLEPAERSLLQDASVLGRTFTLRGLAALAGRDEGSLAPLLDDLVRKELLYLDADPFSPERGQYGFVQALVQRVAYDTLARRDRKARHVAAAEYLAGTSGLDTDEIAEVIAAHYLDAFHANEDADDALEIRAHARSWLERAAERARSLAAAEEAQRAYESAADLAEDPLQRAGLLEQAGDMARMASRFPEAQALHIRARDLFREAGDTHAAARATAGAARVVQLLGRAQEAIELGEDAYAILAGDEPDLDTARLAAELARLHYFTGDLAIAAERVELALRVAERERDMPLLASALMTKALTRSHVQPYEAYVLTRGALDIALAHDLVFHALRAYNNLAIALDALDRVEEIPPMVDEALALARRRGDREWTHVLSAAAATEYAFAGRWDEAEEVLREADLESTDVSVLVAMIDVAEVVWQRGRSDEALQTLDAVSERLRVDDPDFQRRGTALSARRVRKTIVGDAEGALADAEAELDIHLERPEQKVLLAKLLRAVAALAPAIADTAPARRMSEAVAGAGMPTAPRVISAAHGQLEGVLAALSGDHDAAAERFGVALAAARSIDYVPWVAEILVDYAASLVADDRADDAEPLLAEAREIGERLGWARLLARIDQLAGAERVEPVHA